MIFLILLNILWFPVQSENGMDLIKKIQNKFETIENLESNFRQESSASEQFGSFEGKFYYKKGGMFRIELPANMIISDGQKIWNHDLSTKRVIISPITNDPLSFSLERFVMEYPDKCTVSVVKNDTNEKVIKLIPSDDFMGFNSAKIFVDGNFIVSEIEIEDYTNNNFSFSLNGVKINRELPEDLFILYPPEGTEIIDLR
jgi:outer membrane lipoprotein-sorting protein